MLAKTTVSQPPKKKRAKKTKKPQNIPAGVSRGPNASGTTARQGEVVISRSELMAEVASTSKGAGNDTGYAHLFPDASTLSWLHKVRSAFDRIEWLSATLHYKSFVGTNTSGSVAFGVDWNSNFTAVTRSKVQALTPVYETPIWQSGQITLPARYLMTRKVYLLEADSSKNIEDRQPGTVLWALAGVDAPAATTKTVGEIWCTYKVRLSGTTA